MHNKCNMQEKENRIIVKNLYKHNKNKMLNIIKENILNKK